MPQIVVTANEAPQSSEEVVLRERIASSDLESDQFNAHLLERIGWALSDADSIEDVDPRASRGRGARSAQGST